MVILHLDLIGGKLLEIDARTKGATRAANNNDAHVSFIRHRFGDRVQVYRRLIVHCV